MKEEGLQGMPLGFKSFFSVLNNAYNDWIQPDKLNIEELDEGIMKFDDFTLISGKTLHIDSSLAYRIESEGKSKAKRLIISHLYPICDELDVIKVIREQVDAETILAEDLLEVEI